LIPPCPITSHPLPAPPKIGLPPCPTGAGSPPFKRCTKCGTRRPIGEFHIGRGNPDGLQYHCKKCVAKASQTPKARHRQHAYAQANKDRRRVWCYWGNVRKDYGVTRQRATAMLEAQAGTCAICGMKFSAFASGRLDAPCIDHDHKTGRVRGLLCRDCNTAIARLKDRPELCIAAAEYLR
jgi:hypothetical protein